MSITSGPHVPSRGTAAGIAVTIEPSLTHEGDLQIHLSGELDYCSGPSLAHALIGLGPPVPVPEQRSAEVVFDIRQLTFLDLGGLRALEAVRRKLLEAGWLVTARPAQPHVQRLLRFAERAGWLVDGPLMPKESAHADQPGRPVGGGPARRQLQQGEGAET